MKTTALMAAGLVTLSCIPPQPCFADRMLPAAEAKVLFSGKTFDGFNEKTKATFTVYAAPDGTHNLVYPDKKVTGKWSINDKGRHCVELPNSSTCTDVAEQGGGVYYKMDGAVHTHTLKHFRDGDKR